MPRTTNLNNKPPLGTMIAKRLKKMGKQQIWLAQELGVSKEFIWKIINGRYIPSLAMLQRIAEPLNLDPVDLVAALLSKDS